MKNGWTFEEGNEYLEYFKQYLTNHPIVNSKIGKGSGWKSTHPDEKVPRLWIRLRIDVEFSEIGHIDSVMTLGYMDQVSDEIENILNPRVEAL